MSSACVADHCRGEQAALFAIVCCRSPPSPRPHTHVPYQTSHTRGGEARNCGVNTPCMHHVRCEPWFYTMTPCVVPHTHSPHHTSDVRHVWCRPCSTPCLVTTAPPVANHPTCPTTPSRCACAARAPLVRFRSWKTPLIQALCSTPFSTFEAQLWMLMPSTRVFCGPCPKDSAELAQTTPTARCE